MKVLIESECLHYDCPKRNSFGSCEATFCIIGNEWRSPENINRGGITIMPELHTEWGPLKSKLGTLISSIDGKLAKIEAEERRIQNLRDDNYLKGLEDGAAAIRIILMNVDDGGMPLADIKRYFGDKCSADEIVFKHDIKDTVDKVLAWEKEKIKESLESEVQFNPGDVVKLKDYPPTLDGTKLVVLRKVLDEENTYVCVDENFNNLVLNTKNLLATNEHVDGIPIRYSDN